MWVKLIDRGGLVHCTNDFYVFLHELEVVAKSIFKQATHIKGIDIPNIIIQIKSKTDIILTRNSVCSTTELVKSEVYEKVQDDLLTEILHLYITLRGFASDGWRILSSRDQRSYKGLKVFVLNCSNQIPEGILLYSINSI